MAFLMSKHNTTNLSNSNFHGLFTITTTILITTTFILLRSPLPCHAGPSEVKRYPGVYGDPHFTGWDGVNFDFTGEPGGIYCIISDPDLHVNMELRGEKEDSAGEREGNGEKGIEEVKIKLPNLVKKEEGKGIEFGRIRMYNQMKLKEEHIKKDGKEAMEEGRVHDHIKKDGRAMEGGIRAYKHIKKEEKEVMQGEFRVPNHMKKEENAGVRVYNKRTWIKSLGIMYRGHRIVMKVRGGGVAGGKYMDLIEIDGEKAMQELYQSTDGLVKLSYGGRKGGEGVDMAYEEYNLELGLGLGLGGVMEMRVKAGPEVPEERHGGGMDAFLHLSVEVLGGSQWLTGGVHGVLGQTLLNARGRVVRGSGSSYTMSWNPLLVQAQVDGPNGDGYLDGSAPDYLASGLLHSDCRFSRFNPNGDVRPTPSVSVTSPYSRRHLIPT